MKLYDDGELEATYTFNEDGTYIVKGNFGRLHLIAKGEPHDHIKGEWNYNGGMLRLRERMRCSRPCEQVYRVEWFGDDEMELKWESAQAADAYYNTLPPSIISQSLKKASFTADGCFCLTDYVDGAIKYVSKSFYSPTVYKRISDVSRQQTHNSLPCPKSQRTVESKSYYKILTCERESGKDFAYKFVLQLTEDAQRSLRAFRAVQQEFRTVIRDDYMEAFKLQNDNSLFVDFPVYQQKENRIEGRAVVLTIAVTALTYDPNTRTGKLAVRVNANQYEEARKWIRKNIETLARDKNVALTTDEIPPSAKFYLGREELKDGNVLEIEFKTE